MSKVELSAYEKFAEPREVEVLTIVPNKRELGKQYKREAGAISAALEAMSECERRGGVGGWCRGKAGWGEALQPESNPPAPHTYARAGDAMEMKAKLDAGESAPLSVDGQRVQVDPGFVEIKKEIKRMTGRNFTPAVIEPSFGIGRILYCIFEHCYYAREGDEQRTVFGFTPLIAPVKCTVFPLLQVRRGSRS